MDCSACGKEVPANSKFCEHCGNKIDNELKEVAPDNEENDNTSIWSKIANFGITTISLIIGYSVGWVMLLIIIIPFSIGTKFANWYGGKKGNTTLVKIITWSNIISWYIPVVGYFTAGSAISFANLKTGNERKQYLILGFIGLIVSLVNSIVGVLT